MWYLVALAVSALLVPSCDSYFFESGFSHHYTYWAESSLFGERNVTTILKVCIYLPVLPDVRHALIHTQTHK